ncbi:hypothetical protein ABTN41_20190, partial [Acinetobacter baumannii]
QEVTFGIDDLYCNFVGLPEYVGAQPASLIMNGISRLEIHASSDELPIRIIDFELTEVESCLQIEVTLGPAGHARIHCSTVAC